MRAQDIDEPVLLEDRDGRRVEHDRGHVGDEAVPGEQARLPARPGELGGDEGGRSPADDEQGGVDPEHVAVGLRRRRAGSPGCP